MLLIELPPASESSALNLLEKIGEVPGDLIAIEDGKGKLTYHSLREGIAQRCTQFSTLGLGPGKAISVERPRSADCIIDWLAAWKCGAAFIAIDPALPDIRKNKYQEFGVVHVVLDQQPYRRVGKDASYIDNVTRYVFHSSGSTGEPKTICMPTTGLWPVIEEQIKVFQIKETSRVYWMLSPGFDASLSDVFSALCSGATLCIAKDFQDVQTFLRDINTRQITHIDIPPSLLSRLDFSDFPESIQCIIVGGELCSEASIQTFSGKIRMVNCYGPTETTVCSSMKILTPGSDPRNIGTPIPETIYRVENEELWISSPGVSLDYPNQKNTDRFKNVGARRWFKSGDRVREHEGEFFFLGRLDRQFKINGQLVNPEEIEIFLRGQKGVNDVRVEQRGNAIVAMCELDKDLELGGLRKGCQDTLPLWMVPRIIRVEAIQRNENEKIEFSKNEPCPILEAMSHHLGFRLEEDDNFLKVGGDSLLAFDLIQALCEKGIYINVEDLRHDGTPRGLRNLQSTTSYRTKKEVKSHSNSYLKKRPKLDLYSSRIGSKRRQNRIVLTGATGFLGRRLLKIIMAKKHKVTCIVRAKTSKAAKERLFSGDAPPNVEVLAGDLGQAFWGLEEDVFNALSNRCGTLIHLAADLNLSSAYSPESVFAIFDPLMTFLESGAKKKMVFASTLSVFANTDFEENKDLRFSREGTFVNDDTKIYGAYACEKTLAEEIIVQRYPDACVLRMGLLCGDSRSGEVHKKNTLIALIRTIARLGHAPRPASQTWQFDMTPVDYAARACDALMEASGIFHIANAQSTTLDNLVAAIEEHLHAPILRIPPAEFLALLDGSQGEDVQLARMGFARCNSKVVYDIIRPGDLFLASGFDFDGTKTETLLAKKDCKREVDNPNLLKRYVEWALRKSEV